MSQVEVCLGNQQIVENAVSPPIGNTSKPDHVTVTHKRQLPDAIDDSVDAMLAAPAGKSITSPWRRL